MGNKVVISAEEVIKMVDILKSVGGRLYGKFGAESYDERCALYDLREKLLKLTNPDQDDQGLREKLNTKPIV